MSEDIVDGSVTLWLTQLKAGSQEPLDQLWKRYFSRLEQLARKRMANMKRTALDEEDVAASAMESLYMGLAEGRFPDLADRDELWKLLMVITARKALGYRRKYFAGKRRLDRGEENQWLEQVAGREPTPAFEAEIADETRRLLELLPEESLRQVAIGKLHGEDNAQIASRLQVTVRTIERKLATIRKIWSVRLESGDSF